MPALEYDTSSLSQIQTTLSPVKMPTNFNNGSYGKKNNEYH